MHGILDTELVKAAYEAVEPQIRAFMANRSLGSNLVSVVTATSVINPRSQNQSFREQCYYIASIADAQTPTVNLEEIALAKAEKSARTGRDTAELPPHYLLKGDTLSWGSVVLDDIVVACAGVKPWYDEMFAMWIAAAVRAECKQRFSELQGKTRFLL